MGESENGTCDICKKEDTPINRKYYYYDIDCTCHSPKHFELVYHCKDCTPTPPTKTSVYATSSDKREYKANFLWGFEDNSIEALGYEFANAKTEEYQKACWDELLKKIKENHATR